MPFRLAGSESARDCPRDLVWLDEACGAALVVSGGPWSADSDAGARVVERVAETITAFLPDRTDCLVEAFAAVDGETRRLGLRGETARATFAMLLVDDERGQLHVAHAGDARIYLLRAADAGLPIEGPTPNYAPMVHAPSGAMTCLTGDHSTACELVELGFVARETGRERAARRVLTRGLGFDPPSIPDLGIYSLAPRDRVAIVSPSVWLAAPEPETRIFASLDSSEEALVAPTLCALGMRGDGPRSAAAVCLVYAASGDPARDEPAIPGDVTARGPDDRAPATVLPSTSLVDQLGRDLTALARAHPDEPIAGRKDELRRLMRTLMRMTKPNPLLVGEPGVGKTWLVEALARALLSPAAPPALRGKRIVELSLGSLVAGTRYRGDFEERVEGLLREAEADDDLILFLDELHLALGAGGSSDGGLDAANLLKPALARGALRVIGATTTREFDRHIARDEAFTRRFEILRIDEPDRAAAAAILRAVIPRLSAHHGLDIDDDAANAAVELGTRYLPDRRLPDKAIDLLDQACVRAASRWLSRSMTLSGSAGGEAPGRGSGRVTRDDVAAVVAERCRLPVELVALDERERLARLPELLGRRVLGQPRAVVAVAGALQRAYQGLGDPRRPVASFLLVGPTGVGKTSLAVAVAEHVFGSAEALLRLDMSEYLERHAVARLLGSPPGYVGHEEEGLLVTAMRRMPACVVLFDEIEKAHPDVLGVLLQLLDNGVVRDARGREASFRQAIVVLTSNLLAEDDAPRAVGFGAPSSDGDRDDGDAALRARLERHLAPELIGRLGAIVRLDPLAPEIARRIAERHLVTTIERIAARGHMRVPPPSLREQVLRAAEGIDRGARDIERLVETAVGDWLASRSSSAPAPGGPLVSRLGSRRRAWTALLVVRGDDAAAEAIAAHPRAGDLVYLAATGDGAVAAFGSASAAADAALACGGGRAVHWARVDVDDRGRPRGPELDAALAAADDAEGLVVSAPAYEHLPAMWQTRLAAVGTAYSLAN